MQSSFRIIKSTVVEKDTLIFPPAIEKIYGQDVSNDSQESNIIDMQKSLMKETVEEKNRILNEAKIEAQRIIEKAEKKSEEILNDARDSGYQEGYKKGYADGYQFGIDEAEKECSSMRQDAQNFLKSCHEESRKYIKECEREILSLSMNIAKQIIKTELSVNTDAVYKMAESLISKAVDRKQIILKVSPADFNIVKSRKSELSIYVDDISNIVVVADASIEQGNMMAETPSGFIDGCIDTQLDLLFKKLCEDV